jgi:hypothetical protein
VRPCSDRGILSRKARRACRARAGHPFGKDWHGVRRKCAGMCTHGGKEHGGRGERPGGSLQARSRTDRAQERCKKHRPPHCVNALRDCRRTHDTRSRPPAHCTGQNELAVHALGRGPWSDETHACPHFILVNYFCHIDITQLLLIPKNLEHAAPESGNPVAHHMEKKCKTTTQDSGASGVRSSGLRAHAAGLGPYARRPVLNMRRRRRESAASAAKRNAIPRARRQGKKASA